MKPSRSRWHDGYAGNPGKSTEKLLGLMGEFGGFAGDRATEQNSSYFCVLTLND